MNMTFNFFPYLGQILLLAVLVSLMLGKYVKDSRQRLGVVAGFTALCIFLPVFGLSIAQWLRSVLGDFSVLTLAIFINIIAQRMFNFDLLNPISKKRMLLGVVLVGLVFYPLALGVSVYDPYQLGYSPVLMPVILVMFSIIAWFKSMRDLAVILLFPLLAYNLKMLESTNLWDYLIDPVLMGYALVQCLLSRKFFIFKKLGFKTLGQHEKIPVENIHS